MVGAGCESALSTLTRTDLIRTKKTAAPGLPERRLPQTGDPRFVDPHTEER